MGNKQQLPFPEFPTLGYRLREAREQLGLAEIDIADNLRIDRLVIHKIENDLFEPEEFTVFIRGYMRAYAKQVNLSVEEIDTFLVNKGLLQPALALAPAQFELNRENGGKQRKKIRLTTMSVALALVAFVMIWTFWQRPNAIDASLINSAVADKSVNMVASSVPAVSTTATISTQTTVKKA